MCPTWVNECVFREYESSGRNVSLLIAHVALNRQPGNKSRPLRYNETLESLVLFPNSATLTSLHLVVHYMVCAYGCSLSGSFLRELAINECVKQCT